MTPKRALLSVALLLPAAMAAPAPGPGDGPTPTPWQPASISSAQFESHAAFNPLNNDLYFVRSSPKFSGWKIVRSRCTARGWAAPEPAPFSGEGVEADPFFAANGRRLYFISSRKDPPLKMSEDLDIWYVEQSRDGNWGKPVRMPAPINSPGEEWFPRLAGSQLFFGSGRDGGLGQTDIYSATQKGRGWEVRNLGGSVSTAGDEYEFEPSPNGAFAILMADGSLFRVDRRGGGWGPRNPVRTGIPGFHVGAKLSPSGRTLLFAARQGALSGEFLKLPLSNKPENWPSACRGAAR
jgi:hypothetical protein